MLIFLVGYMGCGKSSLGRRLAKRLNTPLVDTDAMVEQAGGASVADLFQYVGEERFRAMEREAIEQIIAEGGDRVVSTGGGLPVWGDNMERLNAVGQTFYIRRSAEQIAARLSPYGRQKRPKLRGLNDEELIEFMQRNMAEREPYYSRATVTLDAEMLPDETLVELIAEIVTRR